MAVTVKDLVNHPYSFAMGVGIANGFLAVGRGKKIDMPTALTLATILGLGEMALIMYEPESERQYSLTATGIYSVLGVLTGLLPFVTPGHGAGGGVPIAEKEPSALTPLLASNAQPGTTAVSGWSRSRRAVAPRRRRYG
jgi:hypothetical protein